MRAPWTSTGTLLATATFTGETASGWQQVNFASPVAITANTTYVVSYHTETGFYSANLSYFATSGLTNGPLRALGNGESPASLVTWGAASGPPHPRRSSRPGEAGALLVTRTDF